jgi:hypothetical protein
MVCKQTAVHLHTSAQKLRYRHLCDFSVDGEMAMKGEFG